MDHPNLTPSELLVLRHMADGLSCKESALALDVKVVTIRSHRQHLQAKLHVSSIEALTVLAVEHVRFIGCCASDSVSSKQ
ncbi:MAG: helix-turn-helix transcriptional regulator [Dehalococcoidia bacterium]|nr:helix-turn-helix transcriptional regulator [Dehalococcoidia bacterium]